MIRVGYPAILEAQVAGKLPAGVERVPLRDGLCEEVEIDVWIPDPYSTRALRIWPYLRGVRLVLALMAGTEWIPAAVGPRVTICNARGAHNISTAEWTVTAILSMLKYVPLYVDIQHAGDWKRRKKATAKFEKMHPQQQGLYPPVLLEELTGKTVLIVGYGEIGKEIERLLAPFQLNILRAARREHADPPVRPVSEIDTLVPQADVIVLILPLTPESHHLFGATRLSLMKQGALLVNAARGPVVDTGALVEALHAGKIRAALDVTDPEPLPPGHPLWSCPNLLITPHVAGSSPQFSPRALQVAVDELERYIKGEPLQNVVQQAS